MKKAKQILSVLLAVLMTALSVPFAGAAPAILSSGYCGGEGDGTNLTWTLYDDGRLVISGNGELSTSPKYYVGAEYHKVIIESGVTEICVNAFSDVSSLTELVIEEGLTKINNFAFKNCSNLINITLPDSLNHIYQEVFKGTAYHNNESNWENGVLYIGKHLIEAQKSISGTYSIKAGTKTIADSAFSGCSNLTGIVFPDSITNMGEGAFMSSGLTSVTVPASIKTIGQYTFSNCTQLTSAVMNEGVEEICYRAFSYCAHLSIVSLPNSLTSIEGGVFRDCTNLNTISLPPNIVYLGRAFDNTGFYNDESNWENDVLYLDNYLLDFKETYTGECVIKDGTKTIPSSAFFPCDGMTGVTIPGSMLNVPSYAFSYSNLENVTIKSGVKCIEDHAFFQSTRLQNVVIEEGTTIIGEEAFGMLWSSVLYTIVLPKSLKTIKDKAFYGCPIRDVYYAGSQEEWEQIEGNSEIAYTQIHYNYNWTDHSHTLIKTNAVAATCTVPGNIAYWICTDPDCGKYFSDANGKNEIAENSWVISINPNNHVNITNVAAIASSCTIKGYSAGMYCNDCKQYISGHTEQPLTAHQTTIINAREATYDADGYTGDTYCTVCKQTLSYGSTISKLTKTEEPPEQTEPTTQPSKPSDEKPAEKLNFFQRIIQWIRNFFAKLFGR